MLEHGNRCYCSENASNRCDVESTSRQSHMHLHAAQTSYPRWYVSKLSSRPSRQVTSYPTAIASMASSTDAAVPRTSACVIVAEIAVTPACSDCINQHLELRSPLPDTHAWGIRIIEVQRMCESRVQEPGILWQHAFIFTNDSTATTHSRSLQGDNSIVYWRC